MNRKLQLLLQKPIPTAPNNVLFELYELVSRSKPKQTKDLSELSESLLHDGHRYDFFLFIPDPKKNLNLSHIIFYLCHYLCHSAYFGHGMTKNTVMAHELYKQASELNNSEAMICVANMLSKGEGCEQKNVQEAIEWLSQSMSLGNNNASYELAIIYLQDDLHQDLPMAMELLKQPINKNEKKSASRGNVDAMTMLGSIYEQGIENKLFPDVQLAVQWYRKAVKFQHLPAYNNLGVLLFNHSMEDSNALEEGVRRTYIYICIFFIFFNVLLFIIDPTFFYKRKRLLFYDICIYITDLAA
ncbi:hypothetical protein RFI_21603 [Reticulomyxa filosa]|uniref:Uncharacterized protein n=1 Tax=Reticulomyxa filosa TaxID=46433 RepID=X6MQ28_RETFI|nr:hypothetical protein RFI_21603 [Reticulomyxa filosa]|eukprot:ETO15761.1 hypothetical protein RFI_21603 [Reticulomyxa filosa]